MSSSNGVSLDLLEEITDDFRLIEGPHCATCLVAKSHHSFIRIQTRHRIPIRSFSTGVIFVVQTFVGSSSLGYVETWIRDPPTIRHSWKPPVPNSPDTLEEWRDKIIETQLNSDSVFYKRHARYDFTDFLLATYSTLTLLDDPWHEVTAERLNERYQSDDELTVDRQLLSGLDEVLGHEEIKAVKEAMEDAKYVEDVLGSLLGVSASTLDVPEVRDRLEQNPPFEVLGMLGRQYIGNIASRVRFESGHNVRDLADTMYDIRKALNDTTDHGYQREAVEYVSEMLSDTDIQSVSDRYKKLKTYDAVDPDLTEQLGQVCNHTQSELDDAVSAAELANRLYSGNPFARTTATLASLKLDNDVVVTNFREVPLTGTSGTDKLGEEFTEVSTHYVD